MLVNYLKLREDVLTYNLSGASSRTHARQQLQLVGCFWVQMALVAGLKLSKGYQSGQMDCGRMAADQVLVAGMGCSASVVCLDLAASLLKANPGFRVLIFNHENVSRCANVECLGYGCRQHAPCTSVLYLLDALLQEPVPRG